jgi:hypothetical protein
MLFVPGLFCRHRRQIALYLFGMWAAGLKL